MGIGAAGLIVAGMNKAGEARFGEARHCASWQGRQENVIQKETMGFFMKKMIKMIVGRLNKKILIVTDLYTAVAHLRIRF